MEEKEYVIFNITTKSGENVEMAVVDEFEFEGNNYVAAGRVTEDTVDEENVFIYKVKSLDDDFEVEELRNKFEYEKVGRAYLEMLDS